MREGLLKANTVSEEEEEERARLCAAASLSGSSSACSLAKCEFDLKLQ